MASAAKPWLICGHPGLIIVTMFLILFEVKPWFILVKKRVETNNMKEKTLGKPGSVRDQFSSGLNEQKWRDND